jgi:hypothetical protein
VRSLFKAGEENFGYNSPENAYNEYEKAVKKFGEFEIDFEEFE